ncbi:DapH/DapD/GlmU-related protein [Rhodococcoides corynebacterioides]|uniref:DapH/DapD/GlmU-related protein n=1 Tax=Rhodococcoides corynebacterioides TaxID=53972 RepID=UPI003F7FF7F0
MSTTRGRDCRIHDTAVVGDGVTIGDRVTIGPFVVVTGPVTIGDDCWIGAQVVLGAPPEILGADHFADYEEPSDGTGIVIGPGTVIRELTAVHQGSVRPTVIGENSFVMNRISVGHDVQLGANTIAAPGVTFGGHVTLGPGCNMGMNSTIHQHRVMGAGAMVGMGGIATKDVPPFATVTGNPARLHAANTVGMSRKGYEQSDIDVVAAAYTDGRLPSADALTTATADHFTWWRELSTKPLVS